MREDILEKEEQGASDKKKTPKPPKEPKAPKLKPEKPAKTALKKPEAKPQTRKSGGKSSGGVIACVFLIVLILAGAMVVYFNVGGSAEAVVAILKENLPAEKEYEGPSAEELEKMHTQLLKLEQTLEKRKTNVDRKEDEAVLLEKDLSEREETLAQQLEAFKTQSEEVYALAQAQASIKATANIYEKMDVQKAADAISQLRPVSYIAQLLKAMDEAKAALILDKMSTKLATSVLSEMMK
ncbi:MAG: hypothetical protein WDA65_02380 [Christensenellales bacterium]